MKRRAPESFQLFTGQFFDGISEETGSMDGTIQLALRILTPNQRDELAAFVRKTFANGLTDAELSGFWRRSRADEYPPREMVREFQTAILRNLEAQGH